MPPPGGRGRKRPNGNSGETQGNRKKGRTGARATKDGRKVKPVLGKEEHRIYRMEDPMNPNAYVSWDGNSTHRKFLDSFVHRYHREVGFECSGSEEEAQEIESDDLLHAAVDEMNQTTYNPKSSNDRATVQSHFESYVLVKLPDTQYGKFLKKIQNCYKTGPKIRYFQPPASTVVTYILHLCRDGMDNDGTEGRCQKYSSIDKVLKCLSGTSIEHGGGRYIRTSGIAKLLATWFEEDEYARAVAFDPVTVLPEAWECLWGLDLPFTTKCRTWTRFLVQLSLIGRSSDVCFSKNAEYCPLVKNVEFPRNARDWTEDGIPINIILVFTDWKGRPAVRRGTPYKVRLYHNPLDFRWCPIHWLLYDWSIRCDVPGFEDGPILPPISATTYQGHLKLVFHKIGVDCSSHSIRRTGAQLAARCGCDLDVIRDIGRWVCVNHVADYLAEGRAFRHRMMQEHDEDPISKVWVFNPLTALSSMSMSASQLDSA